MRPNAKTIYEMLKNRKIIECKNLDEKIKIYIENRK